MKSKIIVWAYLIALSLGTILSIYIPKQEVAAKEAVVIPNQAIRLRILANSDLQSDQDIKRQVRDAVNAKISIWVKDLTSIKGARSVIKSKLPDIQKTAEAVVKQQGSHQAVKVKFGEVQFPTKLYGEFLYPAGNYEAILITLGEGKGANWWCVLYPPLCFLDFSNGVAVSDGFEDNKQKSAAEEKQKIVKKVAQTQEMEQQERVPDAASEQKQESISDNTREQKQESISNVTPEQRKEKAFDAAVEQKQESTLVSKRDPSQDKAEKSSQPAKTEKAPHLQQPVSSSKQSIKEAPLYTGEDEQPVKVKFFAVELWNKLF